MRSRRVVSLVALAAVLAAGAGVAVAATTGGGTRLSGVSLPARAASTASTRLVVRPSAGTARTRFVVQLAAPVHASAGDSISVRASLQHPGGCRAATVLGAPVTTGTHRTLTLGAPTHGWCRGTWTGVADELRRPVCTPAQVCPQFVALLPLGSFRFTVRR